MKHRKNKMMQKTGLYLFIVIVLLMVLGITMMSLFSSFSALSDDQDDVSASNDVLIDLGEGLMITKISDYTGMYMEDGSNEAVSNLMMIVVENKAEADLQYAEIKLNDGASVYEFSLSNLSSGSSCVLLEKNRSTRPAEASYQAEAENVVFFNEPMNLMSERFEITGAQGMLNVQNISKKDVVSDIYVYYKYAADELYYGGITFRIKIEGGLAAGEIRQMPAGHYDSDNCVITMVTCNE